MSIRGTFNVKVYKQIKFQGRQYTIDLNLRNAVTVIDGDSGAGRTLIGKLLAQHQSNILYYDYSSVNNLKQVMDTKKSNFSFRDMIVILDNFECLSGEIPQLIEAINFDTNKNTFIIYNRKTSIPLDVNMHSVGKLVFDRDASTFSIQYMFNKED